MPSEIGAKVLLQKVADALQIQGQKLMPFHLETDDVKVVIDIFPLLFPDHVYKIQSVSVPFSGSGFSGGLLPPGLVP